MLSAIATVTLHLSYPGNPSPAASEINILYCLSVLDFTDSKDPLSPAPPPLPPCPQKKWCRINSDTPQFLIKTTWAIKYSYFSIAVRTANLRTQDLTPFLDFLSTNGLSTASCCIIDHFTVMSLVPYPPSERDAEVDLVLIQTSFLFL